eukprot:766948-Hanusia_phi.AAC.2
MQQGCRRSASGCMSYAGGWSFQHGGWDERRSTAKQEKLRRVAEQWLVSQRGRKRRRRRRRTTTRRRGGGEEEEEEDDEEDEEMDERRLADRARSYGALPSMSPRTGHFRRSQLYVGVVSVCAVVALLGVISFQRQQQEHDSLMENLPTSFMLSSLSSHHHASKHRSDDLQVEDTTGRLLTDAAIQSSGLYAKSDDSDDTMAVLEAAGRLKPKASRVISRKLPAYVQVAHKGIAVPEDYDHVANRERKLRSRKAQQQLDKLNQGYAKQMQKYLTGSDAVGDVTDAIDSRSASYLANTGRFGKKISASTASRILRVANAQSAHEKSGLLGPGRDGSGLQRIWNSGTEAKAAMADEDMTKKNQARGVVWTQNGYYLRIDPKVRSENDQAANFKDKAHLQQLDGCSCTGSTDEDKGPRCNCNGQPVIGPLDSQMSPSERTYWDEGSSSYSSNKQVVQVVRLRR